MNGLNRPNQPLQAGIRPLSQIKSLLKSALETPREKGQTIVILAAALVVLIGFVGLAVDLGFLWMRQAQLRTVVDAAVLAGAPELGTIQGITPADQRAIQYLATNQNLETYGEVDLNELSSFQSSQGRSPLGAYEYTITVTWGIDLFFMPVLGFDDVDITESATAAYFPLVDLYAGRRVTNNGVTTSTQSVFGPEQVTRFGDAFSPFDSPFPEALGLVDSPDDEFVYTYRVEVPENYEGVINVGDDGTGNSELRTNIVRIELLDPDSINQFVPGGEIAQHSRTWYDYLTTEEGETFDRNVQVDEDLCDRGQGGNIHQPCVISTCEWEDGSCNLGYSWFNGTDTPYDVTDVNPFWIYRMDELRTRGGNTTSQENGTATEFTLYYFQRQADGTIVRRNLARYVGQSGASDYTTNGTATHAIGQNHSITDLKWVSPGAYNEGMIIPAECTTGMLNGGYSPGGDICDVPNASGEEATPNPDQVDVFGRGFEVNTEVDLPGIVKDASTGFAYLYVDVKTRDGASENGFEIWAGPPYAHYITGWSDINQRNLLITDDRNAYTTQGVSVYSVGILPLNSLTNNRVDFPLVYVKPEYAGETIDVSLFDADSGANYPLCFYFDTIPNPPCLANYNASQLDGYLVYYDESNDSDLDANGVMTDRCFPNACNDRFVSPPFRIEVPQLDETTCNPNAPLLEDRMYDCNEFLGGRLMVSYLGGSFDTYQWYVTFPSIPYLVR